MSQPTTHKAVILSERKEPPEAPVIDVPYPTISPGSAVVKVLAVAIGKNIRSIFNGTFPYPMLLPMTPGGGGIGRIHEVGPDTVSLEPGQLVLITYQVKARDDPSYSVMQGGFSFPGPAAKLSGEWRNGSLSQYGKFPLENIFPLDENRMVKELGYTYAELAYALILLVPFGGYADTNVKPGDAVLVAPATGEFGGAAVTLALALGATVIAAGRNENVLKKMVDIHGPSAGGRFSYVKLIGDAEVDGASIKAASPNGKGIDVFIDFSPSEATNSTHIEAGFNALRTGGQISLMGGLFTGVTLPYSEMVFKSIKVKGKYMYEREEILKLIALIEAGIVKLGKDVGIKVFGPYGLDEVLEATSVAAENNGWGPFVVVAPNDE